jgi:hypothetical protein
MGRVPHNGLGAAVGNTALRLTMQDDVINSVGAPTPMPVSDAIADNTGRAGDTPSPVPASPLNGKRHSSGYARLRERHHRLVTEHETLKGDFAALSEMYRQVETALYENTELLERLGTQRPIQRPQYRPEPDSRSAISVC